MRLFRYDVIHTFYNLGSNEFRFRFIRWFYTLLLINNDSHPYYTTVYTEIWKSHWIHIDILWLTCCFSPPQVLYTAAMHDTQVYPVTQEALAFSRPWWVECVIVLGLDVSSFLPSGLMWFSDILKIHKKSWYAFMISQRMLISIQHGVPSFLQKDFSKHWKRFNICQCYPKGKVSSLVLVFLKIKSFNYLLFWYCIRLSPELRTCINSFF